MLLYSPSEVFRLTRQNQSDHHLPDGFGHRLTGFWAISCNFLYVFLYREVPGKRFKTRQERRNPSGFIKREKTEMPMKKACTTAGCPNLTDTGGKCSSCRRETSAARGTTDERGYGADFRRLRVPCFERDAWRCVDCGFEPDIVRMCREVGLPMPPAQRILEELRLRLRDRRTHLNADHVIPIDQAPELRLELSNLVTRCNRCNVSRMRKGNPHPDEQGRP